MAKQRYVNDSFWTDPYVEKLDPSEKLLFLYFLTNPLCNVAGIYEIRNNRVAYETGFDKDMVEKIKIRFVEDGKILIFKDWICIVNFVKNQSTNPSVDAGIKRIVLGLPEDVQKTFFEDFKGGVKIKKRSVENFKLALKNSPFCKKCGEVDNLQVDHIVPMFAGGDNTFENLQVLCRGCHIKKSNEDLERQAVTGCPTLLNLTLPNLTKPTKKEEPVEPEVSKTTLRGIEEIIKAMESIDPKNQRFYGNTTQRDACEFLIKTYGLENVLDFIQALAVNPDKVFNIPTTPKMLMDNWVRIVAGAGFEKYKQNKNQPNLII